MPFIVIENGPLAGQRFEVTGTLIVGRQAGCNVVLDDQRVSRRHAAFIVAGERCEVVDLGSRNGTFVNGQRVERCVLKAGDALQVGGTLFRYGEKPAFGLHGQALGGYEILEVVGSGGMGKVYRARQISMDRIVALKVLHKHLTNDSAFVEQFVREARAAGRLDHSNVIHVYDVGKTDDTYYFSMEFVEGVPVSRLLERGPLPLRQAVDIVLAIAQALLYAHNQGIVHGDVKPHNMMVGESGVKLADLGLARSLSHPDELRNHEPRRAWGTPKYMAPELARGQSRSPATDIYSLGATLYHMLTGRAPFTGSDPREILRKVVHEPLRPVRELNPDVPVPLALVVEKMLAKTPEERQLSMRQVIDDLVEARAVVAVEVCEGDESGDPSQFTEASGGETVLEESDRKWLWALVVVLVAVFVGGVATLAWYLVPHLVSLWRK